MSDWVLRNQFVINSEKSQAIVIGSISNIKITPVTALDGIETYVVIVVNEEKSFSEFLPVIGDDGLIKFSEEVINLGLTMNCCCICLFSSEFRYVYK